MKNWCRFILLLLGMFLSVQHGAYAHIVGNSAKKKIVILTSKGGYTHMAVAKSLEEFFGHDYEMITINPFETVLVSLDIVKKITFNNYDGEEAYNSMLRSGWTRVLNFCLRNIGLPTARRQANQVEKLLTNYLAEIKPDMLISVIPVISLPASNAAKNLNIPFLLITLDNDLTAWVPGLKDLTHQKFATTIGFETPLTRPMLRDAGIPDTRITMSGFPVRKDFLETKDIAAIKRNWEIPDDKFVITLVMGGAGSNLMYRYARIIAKLNRDVHLMVLVGKNEYLGTRLKKISCSKKVSLRVVEFTDRVSDLMAASDLLITKPGPSIITEALYMKLPMLIDHTTVHPFWENINISFVTNNRLGDEVKSLGDLKRIIYRYIDDRNYYQAIKSNITSFEKEDFYKKIGHLINTMCPPRRLRFVDHQQNFLRSVMTSKSSYAKNAHINRFWYNYLCSGRTRMSVDRFF
ncbi:hypothetical protein IPF37_04040 [bacterium]|nr:MAG: hypothetical protein IPF37_04040 [bacterium]